MLDRLRGEGVVAIHDRRVPGRRTNIDHVAGRSQDKMIAGVQQQMAVVRDALADQGLDQGVVRGVLCFTKADLPSFRPSPAGVLLHYPRGLRRELRQAGVIDPSRVGAIAEHLARRLPRAG
jgi:hypothetical protein